MPIDHLPDKWRHKAECLRGVVMSDAGVMLILGVSMIVRGGRGTLHDQGVGHAPR